MITVKNSALVLIGWHHNAISITDILGNKDFVIEQYIFRLEITLNLMFSTQSHNREIG